MKNIVATIKQLFILMSKSKKRILIPIILLIMILALVIVAAQISPVPVFLYPFI